MEKEGFDHLQAAVVVLSTGYPCASAIFGTAFLAEAGQREEGEGWVWVQPLQVEAREDDALV